MTEGRRIIDERIEEVRKLVYRAVKEFFGKKGYENEDLFQEAMVGVLTRGDEYDPERGTLGTFVTIVTRTWLISRRFMKDARDSRRINFETMSLDVPLRRASDNENARTLMELIPDDFNLEEDAVLRLDAENMDKLIDTLDERTARIIRERYLEDKTYRVLAQKFGLSRERVRQLETSGLRRLRVKMEHKKMACQRRQPLNRQ